MTAVSPLTLLLANLESQTRTAASAMTPDAPAAPAGKRLAGTETPPDPALLFAALLGGMLAVPVQPPVEKLPIQPAPQDAGTPAGEQPEPEPVQEGEPGFLPAGPTDFPLPAGALRLCAAPMALPPPAPAPAAAVASGPADPAPAAPAPPPVFALQPMVASSQAPPAAESSPEDAAPLKAVLKSPPRPPQKQPKAPAAVYAPAALDTPPLVQPSSTPRPDRPAEAAPQAPPGNTESARDAAPVPPPPPTANTDSAPQPPVPNAMAPPLPENVSAEPSDGPRRREAPLAFSARLVPIAPAVTRAAAAPAAAVNPPGAPRAEPFARPAAASPSQPRPEPAPQAPSERKEEARQTPAEVRPADPFRPQSEAPGTPQSAPAEAPKSAAMRTEVPPPESGAPPRSSSAAPPEAAPQPPETAVRGINLHLAGQQQVAVRLVERAGEVQVSVRTPDARLADTLRDNLAALGSRLESVGFRSEPLHPAPLSAETRHEIAPAAAPPRQSETQSGSQGGKQDQQDGRPKDPPKAEPKQKGNAFAWLMSSLS